jgi:hypothetical protein
MRLTVGTLQPVAEQAADSKSPFRDVSLYFAVDCDNKTQKRLGTTTTRVFFVFSVPRPSLDLTGLGLQQAMSRSIPCLSDWTTSVDPPVN